jgi:periplasmic protein TonB
MRTLSASTPKLLPTYFRPLAYMCFMALHAGGLAVISVKPAHVHALDALDIALVSELANTAPLQTPDQLPDEPPPTPPEKTSEAIPPDEPAPQIKQEKPKPKITPPKPKTQQHTRALSQQLSDGPSASSASDLKQARAAYASIILARINAAKFYPAEARKDNITGNVGVAFSIGADGTVTRASLRSSSGSSLLDEAALRLLRNLHAPPPPAGAYSAATTIRYTIGR